MYNQFTPESLKNSEKKALLNFKKVDYMIAYTSDLVKAVRKAAGNIGMAPQNYLYNSQYVWGYN